MNTILAQERQESADDAQKRYELMEAKRSISKAVCVHPEGMGFDEIYERHIDYGTQTWEVTIVPLENS
jgi:hypothetical protein